MMATRILILTFASSLLLSLRGEAAEAAPSTNAPAAAANTFESFRIIAERNIFNQNRSSKTALRETAPARPVPVIQSFSLVGTMSFKKGTFAFFDGTRTEFKMPLKAGERIAGYEIKEIKPGGVKIANETNEFDIKVGQQLRRENEDDWQLSTAPAPAQISAATADSNASPATAAGSEDEALKRLMEKRAKELNP
ncbi:MAG: hypothetical protein ACXW3L_07330 [Limisphaerales bacterium]